MRTVALLPLHHGSILLPTSMSFDICPEITTINIDGEIIRNEHNPYDGFDVPEQFDYKHRNQNEIEYHTGDGYTTWTKTVAGLADKQAFSFRQNGETKTMFELDPDTKTLEIEPLDRGGILIATQTQLPFGVYLTTGESYRVDIMEGNTPTDEGIARLSYRQDNRSEWDVIEEVDVFHCQHLVKEIGEKTDMVAMENPDVEDIRDMIESQFETSHERAQSQTKEETYNNTAVETDTAFNITIPAPKPLYQD